MFASAKSGLYTIQDPCSNGDKDFTTARLTVYCDMDTDGGGWIVIQRRNASMGWVNFVRGWTEYEKGFGDLDGEFWIGLKNIYELTNQQRVALKIKVWNDTGTSINWNYPSFMIFDGNQRYYASSGSGSGDGRYSAFRYETNVMYFHTYDYYSGNNCGHIRQSGWWYYNGVCDIYANPNGRHTASGLRGTYPVQERLMWRTSNGYEIFTHSEMKIRQQSCPLR